MGSVDQAKEAMDRGSKTSRGNSPEKPATDQANVKERWGTAREVVLDRVEGAPLGISIVGGRLDPFKNSDEVISGIFIKNVIADTPAGRIGTLEIGDRILEVNGTDLREASYEDAVKAIRGSPTPVKFLVQSLLKQQPKVDRGSSVDSKTGQSVTKQESLSKQDSIQKNDRIAKDMVKDVIIVEKTPSKEEKEEDEDEDDDDDDEDDEDEDETSKEKRPKYHDLTGTIHTVELDCDGEDLGLCLAGNRDLGTMSVFVAGVRPHSTVARDGRIIVGDELLEVNDQLLFGRSHLNATAIIKGEAHSAMTVMFIRSEDALDRMAVKPLTPIGTPHHNNPDYDHENQKDHTDGNSEHSKLKLTDNQENGVEDLPSPVKSAVQKDPHQDTNRRPSNTPLEVPTPGRRRSSATPTSETARQEEAVEAYREFTVDLIKKHGRGLGVSIKGSKDAGGIFISEMVKGGVVDMDGRLLQGDQILSVNGEDLMNIDPVLAITVIKTLVGKLALTVRRNKMAAPKNGMNGEHLRKSASSADHSSMREGSEGIPSSESY